MAGWKALQLAENKYTDAEAVAAVATADDYVKNTGDTMTGALNIHNSNFQIENDLSAQFKELGCSDGSGTKCQFLLYGSRGNSLTSKTVLVNGDVIFDFTCNGYDGSTYNTVGNLRGKVIGVSAGNIRFEWGFLTSDAGGTRAYRLRIRDDKIENMSYVYLTLIRSGATQVAAGAATSEIWKTSGHATLPDNVLMIGV